MTDLEKAKLALFQMELVAYRAIERMKQAGIDAGDGSKPAIAIMNNAAKMSLEEINNITTDETNWRVD